MIKTYKIYENVLDTVNAIEFQNRENKKIPCECDCFSYGSLLDNYIIYGKRCIIFFKEMYVNEWTSGYIMKTCAYIDKKGVNDIIDEAYLLMDDIE